MTICSHPAFPIMRDIFFSFFGSSFFPSDFISPWWDMPSSLSEVDQLPPDDHTQVEDSNITSPTSSFALEPHPPGTPILQKEAEVQQILDNQDISPNVDMSQALILRPPLAAGFEDEDQVAPLNREFT
jgi:hypothetical protein